MLFNPTNRANLLKTRALSLVFFGFTILFPKTIFSQNDSVPSVGKVLLTTINEETVNSEQLEFSPTFYEDGIVFSSTNPAGLKKEKDESMRRPATSILRSQRGSDGKLGKPEPFAKELTTPYNEGPVSFDRTAETIFFSRNILQKGQQKRDKKGVNRMAIYMSRKENGTWSKPIELPFNTDAQWDDVHPCLSIDGDKLYFASNRPGGFGGMDLYVSTKNGDSWNEPTNLGATVNTPKNEVFPFIHADNTLYFASTGHKGVGGLDMFFTQPEENGWTAPINLGAPFNSVGDDFGLIVDLDKINGYFSSNGVKGKGGDEILSFHTENGNLDAFLQQNGAGSNKELDLLVSVFEANGDPIEAADVKVVSIERNNVIGKDSLGREISVENKNGREVLTVGSDKAKPVLGQTDTGGRFETKLKGGNYAIIVSKDGFQSKQLTRQLIHTGNEVTVTLDKADGKVHLLANLVNPLDGSPIAGATIVLKDKATGEQDTIYSDGAGHVDYHLKGGKNYDATVFQGNREVGKTTISTEKFKAGDSGELSLNLEIEISPLVAGNVIQLPNIYYNFNDATIRPDAGKDLDAIAAMMKLYPKLTFELAAHTDSRGSTAYNDALSQRRADNAAAYLIKKGQPESRFQAKGYGERDPVNRCEDGVRCPESQHALNRRTELRVISGLEVGQTVQRITREVIPTSAKLEETTTSAEPVYVEKTTAPRKAAKPKVNASPSKISKGTATYFVIAGSFLMESRANKRLSQVKKLGFNEARIQEFPDEKDFMCVVVLETNSFDEAQAYASQLAATNEMHTRVKTVAKN